MFGLASPLKRKKQLDSISDALQQNWRVSKQEPLGPNSASAVRMRQLRERIGPQIGAANQRVWAEKILGIEYRRWNNFERGWPLSVEVAEILMRRVPGLELNYLMRGDARYLPPALSALLVDSPAAPVGKRNRRK